MDKELLEQLCYFVDSWLRLMGFGGEYNKLVWFILSVAKQNPEFDFSKYYYINQELKNHEKTV
jgi:hypothetical protein